MNPWINTQSGRRVDLVDPQPEMFDIRDIAYALAGEGRFAGHCKPRLSVAEHSVVVSYHVPEEHAMWGLLDDASEAYLRDIARPLKKLLPGYYDIERKFMRAIAGKFHLCWPMPESVHVADNRCILTEARLFFPHTADFSDLDTSYEEVDRNYYHVGTPEYDAQRFLARYEELLLPHLARREIHEAANT